MRRPPAQRPTSRRRCPPPSSRRSTPRTRTGSRSSTRIRSRIRRRTGARDTLDAVRFAFYALNEQFGDKNPDGSTKILFRAANTIVIASSVSNGGGAAIAAAEQDTEGLIDGVAVAEPVLELHAEPEPRP